MRVGFIGLGRMGKPMAVNIVRAGHDVTVWNRATEPTEELREEGASVAESLIDLGRDRDVICCCLPDGGIVAEALFGPRGALAEAKSGAVVVDHSTISSSDARSLATRCQELSIDYLDAPVSGGPEGATQGNLAVFVGGTRAAFDSVRELLSANSSLAAHLGAPGAGQVGKLANQLIIACTLQGIAEAFAYSAAHGVEAGPLLEILQAATADSRMLRSRAPVPGLQPEMPASRDWQPGFTAEFMAKDLTFALQAASALGVDLPGAALVERELQEVISNGDAQKDWTVFATSIRPR